MSSSVRFMIGMMRDSHIDCYRCLCMLGIVGIHMHLLGAII